jgi:hypothetical protein
MMAVFARARVVFDGVGAAHVRRPAESIGRLTHECQCTQNIGKSDSLMSRPMTAKRVTATEFARNLSSMLSEVRYRETSLEVWRGRELMAHISPPRDPAGFPISGLNALMRGLPGLGRKDADAFLSDLDALDRVVGESDREAWAS